MKKDQEISIKAYYSEIWEKMKMVSIPSSREWQRGSGRLGGRELLFSHYNSVGLCDFQSHIHG